jgi:hypothetical protein
MTYIIDSILEWYLYGQVNGFRPKRSGCVYSMDGAIADNVRGRPEFLVRLVHYSGQMPVDCFNPLSITSM